MDPPPFAPNLIEYPQLVMDPTLSWHIPFLAEVPLCDHHQEEAQVINLVLDIHNPEWAISAITQTLMYLVHSEIPLPGVTELRDDTVHMTQWHARFIKISLQPLDMDIKILPEGRSHFLWIPFIKENDYMNG